MKDLNHLRQLHEALQHLVSEGLAYAFFTHDDIIYKAWIYVTSNEAENAISLEELRTIHQLQERLEHAKAN